MKRSGALILAAGIGLGGAASPAIADITPPAGTTPAVGLTYAMGTTSLWAAGPGADQGEVVNVSTGEKLTFAADPISVQALAWKNDRLWVADIGDTAKNREFVVIYRLNSLTGGQTQYNAFDFQYEDGPRDAKAMMISGRGRIYVVTSGEDAGIYRAELEPSRQSMNTLTRVTDAPAGVTDGAFLSDGGTMVLRTSAGLEYIDAFTWEKVATNTIVGAPAGESVAVGPEDQIFVGGNPVIRETTVPASDTTTTLAPSPSPSPSPKPSASASTTASAQPGTVDTNSNPATWGTTIALGLAALVAVAAGAVTYFVKN